MKSGQVPQPERGQPQVLAADQDFPTAPEDAPTASSAEQGQSDEQSERKLRTQPIDAAAVAWPAADRAKPRNEAQLECEEQKPLHVRDLS